MKRTKTGNVALLFPLRASLRCHRSFIRITRLSSRCVLTQALKASIICASFHRQTSGASWPNTVSHFGSVSPHTTESIAALAPWRKHYQLASWHCSPPAQVSRLRNEIQIWSSALVIPLDYIIWVLINQDCRIFVLIHILRNGEQFNTRGGVSTYSFTCFSIGSKTGEGKIEKKGTKNKRREIHSINASKRNEYLNKWRRKNRSLNTQLCVCSVVEAQCGSEAHAMLGQ